MKFEDIEVGSLIRHKESGKVYMVVEQRKKDEFNGEHYTVRPFPELSGRGKIYKDYNHHELFCNYKEQK